MMTDLPSQQLLKVSAPLFLCVKVPPGRDSGASRVRLHMADIVGSRRRRRGATGAGGLCHVARVERKETSIFKWFIGR